MRPERCWPHFCIFPALHLQPSQRYEPNCGNQRFGCAPLGFCIPPRSPPQPCNSLRCLPADRFAPMERCLVARTEAVKTILQGGRTQSRVCYTLSYAAQKREVHLPKGLFLVKERRKRREGCFVLRLILWNFVYFIFFIANS